MNSRDIIAALEGDGWQLSRVKGSHHHFKHPTKSRVVTVKHPAKDFPIGTIKSVERQSGLKLR